MSIIATLSLILYAAAHTGQTCETVFVESARRLKGVISSSDEKQLEVLSRAACATSNPDIIWQIAYQESSFRTDIISINENGASRVLKGEEAYAYLRDLKTSQKRSNVDIGVMQINWRWHGHKFNFDPIEMMKPERQVEYILEEISPYTVSRCAKDWVGCYHNPSNANLAQGYQRKVLLKTKELASSLLYHIQDSLASMELERRKTLPVIQKKQFYEVWNRAIKMKPPEDLELALYERNLLHIDENKKLTSELNLINVG